LAPLATLLYGLFVFLGLTLRCVPQRRHFLYAPLALRADVRDGDRVTVRRRLLARFCRFMLPSLCGWLASLRAIACRTRAGPSPYTARRVIVPVFSLIPSLGSLSPSCSGSFSAYASLQQHDAWRAPSQRPAPYGQRSG